MTRKSPIKVLHLITRLIVGGAQENTLYTARFLNPQLFDVEVVCGPQTGSEGSLIEEAIRHGVRLSILPELVRELNPIKDLLALMKIFFLLRKNKYAIVHTHSSKAGILGRLAAKLAGTPMILHTVHGWSFHDYMPAWRKHLFIALERITARFTHRLIVVTQKDILKGRAHGIGKPEQYLLIRSAIPLDEFLRPLSKLAIREELGLPQGAPVIGTVGRLSPQKNPLEWIAIAARVAAQKPDCLFLIVGDGPLRAQVEKRLRELDLDGRVILTGLRRDVPRLLAAMDVFLLTSLWEGLPRVLPQAMCREIPIVAYASDGVAEIIEHERTGLLCRPGEVELAAYHCLRLLESPELRQRLVHEAKKVATEHFDLRIMINRLEELYLSYFGGLDG
ncbi:MAG: glycosyltransferase family 4 protein [Anaerolineales bacterium]|nr:glycosyltransferase family 4 protein [Anaerolineales bacterium]MDW8161070.1 glycosyltransferase family 4 protein [Anaerolineales bacterium]